MQTGKYLRYYNRGNRLNDVEKWKTGVPGKAWSDNPGGAEGTADRPDDCPRLDFSAVRLASSFTGWPKLHLA